ncbi:MAG: fumarylacetoacetate hydrolase family protein, partial [Acidimicrobiia bacterium]|nr:fumarylacetoacetate hydrolase family protein [Acidimicrobiia bacterium]
ATADEPTHIGAVNAAPSLYWTPSQQIAHLTVNGATIRPGDLIASGTISGSERSEFGSLLEMSWNGTEPIEVGEVTRTFLENGDEVTLRGSVGGVVLGEVSGTVVA